MPQNYNTMTMMESIERTKLSFEHYPANNGSNLSEQRTAFLKGFRLATSKMKPNEKKKFCEQYPILAKKVFERHIESTSRFELVSRISNICLEHQDSGEASNNILARKIIDKLRSEGYETIRKSD